MHAHDAGAGQAWHWASQRGGGRDDWRTGAAATCSHAGGVMQTFRLCSSCDRILQARAALVQFCKEQTAVLESRARFHDTSHRAASNTASPLRAGRPARVPNHTPCVLGRMGPAMAGPRAAPGRTGAPRF